MRRQYIDERVVMRDYVTVPGNSNPRDHYYLHEELYSEAGLAAANGALEEAYVYDTYGEARIYQWPTGDFDRDGDVDSTDQTTLTSNYTSPAAKPWLDLDNDGDADSADLAVMMTVSAPTELAYSAVNNPYLFTGRLTDTLHANSPTDTTNFRRLQDNRNRIYDPKHGRWMQRDPLEVRPNAPLGLLQQIRQYVGGGDLYEYTWSTPCNRPDPLGLCPPGQELVWHPTFIDNDGILVCEDIVSAAPVLSLNFDPESFFSGAGLTISGPSIPIGMLGPAKVVVGISGRVVKKGSCCTACNCRNSQWEGSITISGGLEGALPEVKTPQVVKWNKRLAKAGTNTPREKHLRYNQLLWIA